MSPVGFGLVCVHMDASCAHAAPCECAAGLETHAGHEIAKAEMTPGLFGAMLSFRVAGGMAAAVKVAATLKLIRRATSLGGECPCIMANPVSPCLFCPGVVGALC